tara:strand:- start:3622 stop:3867 length:246 start_codon:yes stop_codon:yes gene_type:complete
MRSEQQVLADARAASRLQDDEDLTRFLVEMEDAIFGSFRSVKVGETKELEQLHAQLAGIEMIRAKLRSLVDDGAIAQQKSK